MAEYSKKERERYNQYRERIGKEYGIGKNEYNRLRRVGNELHRADEDYANGRHRITNEEYTEKHHKHDVNTAFSKTKALKKKLKDVHYYHQSDPRGASLYISKKKLDQKNYSSEGHHIY